MDMIEIVRAVIERRFTVEHEAAFEELPMRDAAAVLRAIVRYQRDLILTPEVGEMCKHCATYIIAQCCHAIGDKGLHLGGPECEAWKARANELMARLRS